MSIFFFSTKLNSLLCPLPNHVPNNAMLWCWISVLKSSSNIGYWFPRSSETGSCTTPQQCNVCAVESKLKLNRSSASSKERKGKERKYEKKQQVTPTRKT